MRYQIIFYIKIIYKIVLLYSNCVCIVFRSSQFLMCVLLTIWHEGQIPWSITIFAVITCSSEYNREIPIVILTRCIQTICFIIVSSLTPCQWLLITLICSFFPIQNPMCVSNCLSWRSVGSNPTTTYFLDSEYRSDLNWEVSLPC